MDVGENCIGNNYSAIAVSSSPELKQKYPQLLPFTAKTSSATRPPCKACRSTKTKPDNVVTRCFPAASFFVLLMLEHVGNRHKAFEHDDRKAYKLVWCSSTMIETLIDSCGVRAWWSESLWIRMVFHHRFQNIWVHVWWIWWSKSEWMWVALWAAKNYCFTDSKKKKNNKTETLNK